MDEKKHMDKMPHDGVERASFRLPEPVDGFRRQKPDYWKAERIAKNIQAEGDAIKEYMELLACLDPVEDAGTIKAINEVVAEEKKHVEILQKIMMAYDGHIKPEKPELPEGMEHKEGHRRGLMNK